jgi:hypothetical protein
MTKVIRDYAYEKKFSHSLSSVKILWRIAPPKQKAVVILYSYWVQRYEKKPIPPSYFVFLNTRIKLVKNWISTRYEYRTHPLNHGR